MGVIKGSYVPRYRERLLEVHWNILDWRIWGFYKDPMIDVYWVLYAGPLTMWLRIPLRTDVEKYTYDE